MIGSKPKPWNRPDIYASATPEAIARALLRPLNPHGSPDNKTLRRLHQVQTPQLTKRRESKKYAVG